MKITFIKDCPAIFASGNSVYAKGAKADLVGGESLIDLGYAHEGWGKLLPEIEDNPEYSLYALREMAKNQGIKGYARMKKLTLKARLGID